MGGRIVVASFFLDVSGVTKISVSASSLLNCLCTWDGPVLGVKRLFVSTSEVSESDPSFIGIAASSASLADFSGCSGRRSNGC